MIDQNLIEMLRCPIGGGRLRLAEDSLILRVNEAISRNEIRDHQDQRVAGSIEGGLVNDEETLLYPIRGGIPTLVADEAIEITQSSKSQRIV